MTCVTGCGAPGGPSANRWATGHKRVHQPGAAAPPAAGISGWATAVAVFLLVTLALSLLAALIGLLGKSVEVAQQFGAIIIIPVFFSSALVPDGTMPSWLRVVSANQPITQAVGTLRALLLNQPPGSHLWLTLTEFGGIVAAAFTLAAILFKRTANA